VKITVDVPDVDGLPVEIWLTLGKTGYEPHVVAFYDPEDARTVFEKWWQQKQGEAVGDVKKRKAG
jgi:glucose-6-phosphate isomerase